MEGQTNNLPPLQISDDVFFNSSIPTLWPGDTSNNQAPMIDSRGENIIPVDTATPVPRATFHDFESVPRPYSAIPPHRVISRMGSLRTGFYDPVHDCYKPQQRSPDVRPQVSSPGSSPNIIRDTEFSSLAYALGEPSPSTPFFVVNSDRASPGSMGFTANMPPSGSTSLSSWEEVDAVFSRPIDDFIWDGNHFPVASGSNTQWDSASPSPQVDWDMDSFDDPRVEIDAGDFERDGYGIYENINHYARGQEIFAESKTDAIHDFFLAAGNEKQFEGNESMDKALERLDLKSQSDLIPGMKVKLLPHQTIGVAWMVDKEEGSLSGGCLGDEMGLGKTVQMIAVIVKNQSQDPSCKTNLIIAPTSLLDQWKLELEVKTDCGLKCLIYHGPSKPKNKDDILKYDVVLTTYATMSLEWPDIEGQKRREIAKRKKMSGLLTPDSANGCDLGKLPMKRRKEGAGLLFTVDFFRIILDEAQFIRNRRTRMSRAVIHLRTFHRWCLTGTPIINSLIDVYGYLRFLQIKPWSDFAHFQRHVGSLEKKQPNRAATRLQAIIKTFLLRRKKDSELDGKRLIELPDKNVSLVKLEFSQEERDIYKMVEARTQASFNRFLKAGTVLKNYHQVLVLLLRLRQICTHPSLIQEQGGSLLSPEDHSEGSEWRISELNRAANLVSPEYVSKMQRKLTEFALKRMEAEKISPDATFDDEECPICFDILTDAIVTPCTHIFCQECLFDVIDTTAQVERIPGEPVRYAADERPCPVCRSPISKEKLFRRDAFELPDEAVLPESANLDVDSEDVKMEDGDADHKVPVDARNRYIVSGETAQLAPPSTKMKYMIEELRKLMEEYPEEKTVIVSQWTSCLLLASNYLKEIGIAHVSYQGDMNRTKRSQAVKDFLCKDEVRVMLMSLKCGGVGLNLTCANNVISLDLGWSQAIEAQAFDRVHRLGQTRTVKVQRLAITDTVEDRVLSMQERKQTLTEGTLGEGSGKKIGKLTVKELANLFGLDHNGQVL